MKLTQFRLSVRRMMFLVAVATLLLSGGFLGMEMGTRLKEEVRARRAVADKIGGFLDQGDSRIYSLEMRIARSERQAARDPRHDRWVGELAWNRSRAASLRRDLPTYERLASFPWLPFPEGAWEREYLDERDMFLLNRSLERKAAILWSGSGAAVAVLAILLLVLLVNVMARRFLQTCRTGPPRTTTETPSEL